MPTLAPLFAGLFALAIYLVTLAPDLTWAHQGTDGGELITAAVTLGVPHPPGYPTYVLLGKVISLIPLGKVAFRFNLLSALCIAAAAALVTAISYRRLTMRHTGTEIPDQGTAGRAALATGLTFAFMPLVWSQALIAEVYGLNLLLIAAFLWALLRKRPGWSAGLLLGLSVTAHLTSLLLLPLALYLTPWRRWLRLGAGMTLGLTPFLLLPLLGRGESPVVWGRPGTFRGWWWLVSGQLYRPNLFALPREQWLPRFLTWSRLFFAQFAWVGLALLPAALPSQRTSPKETTPLPLLATAGGYALYAFAYNTADAFVFFLPALLLLSILLAPALRRLNWLALLLPLALLMLNFSQVSLRRQQTVRALAEPALQRAPPQAILLTTGDQTTFTFWYLHHVEGQRPDLILVDSNLFAFDWYRQRLMHHHPALRRLARDDLASFRSANRGQRPVCSVALPLQANTLPSYNCHED